MSKTSATHPHRKFLRAWPVRTFVSLTNRITGHSENRTQGRLLCASLAVLAFTTILLFFREASQTPGFSTTAQFAVAQLAFVGLVLVILRMTRSPKWAGALLMTGLIATATIFILGTSGIGLHVPFWMIALPLVGLLLVGPGVAAGSFFVLLAASFLSQRGIMTSLNSAKLEALIPFEVLVVMVLVTGLTMAGWGYSTYISRRLQQATLLLARSRALQWASLSNTGSRGSMPFASNDAAIPTSGVDAPEFAELERLKSTLLANVNHEVRTPLTGILGYTAILDDVLDENERELTRPIKQHASRLLETLNSLLDLAQLESDTRVLTMRPTNLVAYLESLVPQLQVQAREKRLALNLRLLVPQAWASVDTEGLDLIIFHLFSNAVKFTHEGFITLEVGADDASVYLRVSDTGEGIDQSFISHIFEPFRQGSTGETRRYGGNGIGLAIAHKMAGRLKGSISVDSTEGTGSTFTIRLPRIADASASLTKAA